MSHAEFPIYQGFKFVLSMVVLKPPKSGAERFWGRSSAYGKEPTFDPNDLRHAISKQPTRLSLEGDER